MPTASDRLARDVACLDVESIPFTLVSSLGFHCDVWRSIGRLVTSHGDTALDFVLKVSKRRCTVPQVRVLAKEYRILRAALDEMVPKSLFVATTVNGQPGAVVFAETCRPWFDLANPTNEAEARPLLARRPRARRQLRHFVSTARRWLDEDRMLIDIYGGENLVLDRIEGVRYLDSFHVFFYLDTLDAIAEVDDGFTFRIEKSMARLDYLEHLVAARP